VSLFLSQQSAVVQAGAGSGKTHSLVGLCLHLLGGVGRGEPLPPARLCAVTFTEKAAAELQTRLRARLDRLALSGEGALESIEPELAASCAALGCAPPAREIWQRARHELREAEIGTLHSVCTRILRRHAAAAGIDPAFSVLDPLDAQLLLAETCERAVLDALEGDGPRRAAAERLCGETGLRKAGQFGTGVVEDLLRLIAALGESGRTPDELIAATPGLDPIAAGDGLRATRADLSRALDGLAAALPGAKASSSSEKAARALALFRRDVQPALGGAGAFELRALWPALTRAQGELPNKGKNDLGLAVGAVKEAVCALEEADAAMRACGLARDLAALASEAIERVRAEKQRVRALEFDDLTRLARDLLARNPDVRRAEKERIGALLVDEFQDTSRTQLELCGWLAEERGGEGAAPAGSGLPGARALAPGLLFLVGDRKQSIYEFRGADVAAAQAFAERALRDGAQRHFLRTSWRSLPPLVEFANRLFARTLGDAGEPFHAPFILGEDDLSAARARPPREPASGPSAAGPCAELLQVEGDLDDESAAVARRIAAMLSPQAAATDCVQEKGVDGVERARPVRGGDIAILMRSFLPVEALRRALLRARIPHVIVGGRLFHQAREVLDLRALLSLLLEGDDASALAAVLRSPFGPVSDDGLALLARAPRTDRHGEAQPGRGLTREALDDESLLGALEPDDAQAVRRLARLLRRLERERDRLGPSALLEAALAESRYRAAIAGGLFGEQAAANVERLLEMARALEQETARPAGALRSLLARLDALDAMGGGEAEAAVVEEKSAHAVRLLTVHAAKGLEFPIVFVPLAALQSPPGPGLLVDPDLGLALRLKGPSGDTCWGAAGARVRDRREAREQAQSQRLLYVAATRARDRVIFSGRAAEKRERTASWWTLLLEAAADPAIAPLVQLVDARTLPPPSRAVEAPLVHRLEDLEALARPHEPAPAGAPFEAGVRDQLNRMLGRATPPNAGTLIAPVTQLADAARCPRRYQLLHELRIPERPETRDPIAREQTWRGSAAASTGEDDPPLDAAQRGTLAHRMLEQMPLDPEHGEPELRAAASHVLSEAQRGAPAQLGSESANQLIDAAVAFLSSETGQRLRRAPERMRMRELPFGLRLAPRDEEPRGPALLVRGQIDLLLLEGDRATVLDYKLTARRPPEEYALQLGTYALAAHQLIEGRLPVRTGLVFLRARGAPTELLQESGATARESTRQTLLAAARAIAHGRSQSHFAKIEPEGCRAIECGFLRRCHPREE